MEGDLAGGDAWGNAYRRCTIGLLKRISSSDRQDRSRKTYFDPFEGDPGPA